MKLPIALAGLLALAACSTVPTVVDGHISPDGARQLQAEWAASLDSGASDPMAASIASKITLSAPQLDTSGGTSLFVEQPDGSWRVPESAISAPSN